MNKYIYILNIMPLFEDVSNQFIFNNVINEIFDNIQNAINRGCEILKDIAYQYYDFDITDNDISILYNDIINYKFIITKFKIDHLDFECTNDLLNYYKDHINYIKDDDKYDFIMSLIGYENFYYNYKGELMFTHINDKYDDFDIRFTSKSYMNFTCSNFNNGDYVIRKNYNDINAYIVQKEEVDKYRIDGYSGYLLYDPIYNRYINDLPDALYFDQDLIKVEICSKCYAAITSDFINDYYLADNRCPRCLSKIESLED